MIGGDMGDKPSQKVAAGRGRLFILAVFLTGAGFALVGLGMEGTESYSAIAGLGTVLACVGPVMALAMLVAGVKEFRWARGVERGMAERAGEEYVMVHKSTNTDPDCSAWEGSYETQMYFARQMGLDTSIDESNLPDSVVGGGELTRRGKGHGE
jgi:hypothetical protein